MGCVQSCNVVPLFNELRQRSRQPPVTQYRQNDCECFSILLMFCHSRWDDFVDLLVSGTQSTLVCPEVGGVMLNRNVGNILLEFMASHPSRKPPPQLCFATTLISKFQPSQFYKFFGTVCSWTRWQERKVNRSTQSTIGIYTSIRRQTVILKKLIFNSVSTLVYLETSMTKGITRFVTLTTTCCTVVSTQICSSSEFFRTKCWENIWPLGWGK